MRVLLVKTSSMGDLLHTLPAVSDAVAALPGLELTWLVEENLAEIPAWHPGVARVLPSALRRWRKRPLHSWRSGEVGRFLATLRERPFDHIVDAQGLLKSALLGRLARGGVRHGPGADWIRERWALPFYQQRVATPEFHIIPRLRHLLATALGYPVPTTPPRFGLERARLPQPPAVALAPLENSPFVLLLHGTAWTSKVWPEPYWQELGRLILAERGWRVALPWGNDEERQRAQRLAAAMGHGAVVLPRLPLGALAGVMAHARGVVGLDSGFAHLAAALALPTVTLFGATNPDYSGIPSPHQRFLRSTFPCAPCMERRCHFPGAAPLHPACFVEITPRRVLDALDAVTRGTTP